MNKRTSSKVISGNGGFYNPDNGIEGEFYLNFNGTPKIIRIKYFIDL